MSQSNHSPINVIELLSPATFATTALPGGKFAMLFDSDLSHISFLPVTGDGSIGSPFEVNPSGIVDGVQKSDFNTYLSSVTAGTEYSYTTSSFFPPNVVDFAASVTGFTQAAVGLLTLRLENMP